MVQHVIELELQLRLDFLRNGEVFEHRRINVKEFRAAERVASDVSEGIKRWLSPRAGGRAWCATQSNTPSVLEPVPTNSRIARACAVLHRPHFIGAARAGVAARRAVAKAGSE